MRIGSGIILAGLLSLGGIHASAQTQPAALSGGITVKPLGVPCPDCVEGTPVPLTVGGRFYAQSRQWPGAYWEADITGTSFMVVLSDTANMFGVYVDGHKVDTQTKPLYTLFQYSGLSDGPHRIRIETQTESQGSAYSGVTAIMVPNKASVLPAPAPRARQIEFIGDSYTVGYGNTSPKRDCTTEEVWATTDTSQAFGPIAAKAFNADYQINAFSGRGIVKNYDGFAGDTLPQLYKYTIFDGKTLYDPAGWKPQIIVIGLGTNDFSTPLKPDQKWKTREALHADYEKTYVAFVKSLRAKHPDAWFILMATDSHEGEILSEVTKVEAKLKASGEKKLTLIPMLGLNFGGCHAHPDVNDDKAVAKLLSDFINARPELWQGK